MRDPHLIKLWIKITTFFVSLPALIWRLSDFFEEVSVGMVKMSLGTYHLNGNAAIFAQSLIIGLLATAVYMSQKNILQAVSHR